MGGGFRFWKSREEFDLLPFEKFAFFSRDTTYLGHVMTAELCSSSSFQGKQSNPAHSEKLWGKMLTHSSNSSPAQANITGAKVAKKKKILPEIRCD